MTGQQFYHIPVRTRGGRDVFVHFVRSKGISKMQLHSVSLQRGDDERKCSTRWRDRDSHRPGFLAMNINVLKQLNAEEEREGSWRYTRYLLILNLQSTSSVCSHSVAATLYRSADRVAVQRLGEKDGKSITILCHFLVKCSIGRSFYGFVTRIEDPRFSVLVFFFAASAVVNRPPIKAYSFSASH